MGSLVQETMVCESRAKTLLSAARESKTREGLPLQISGVNRAGRHADGEAAPDSVLRRQSPFLHLSTFPYHCKKRDKSSDPDLPSSVGTLPSILLEKRCHLIHCLRKRHWQKSDSSVPSVPSLFLQPNILDSQHL